MALSSSEHICFIGAGSMAEAIIRGLIERKTAAPTQITVINRSNRERLAVLNERYGVVTPTAEKDKRAAMQSATVLVLAMKPTDAATVLTDASTLVHEQQLVVSVIAGLSVHTIDRLLQEKVPIVRTMPNTSSTIGEGVTGIHFSSRVSHDQQQTVLAMFRSIGMTATVDEAQLDTITGVSGSGPAYIYYMMEAMIEAAVEKGFSTETAQAIVMQTVLGAAKMVKQSGENPASLRQKVTSPNGTTEAAIQLMTEQNFSRIVNQAINRSSERAAEIGRSLE